MPASITFLAQWGTVFCINYCPFQKKSHVSTSKNPHYTEAVLINLVRKKSHFKSKHYSRANGSSQHTIHTVLCSAPSPCQVTSQVQAYAFPIPSPGLLLRSSGWVWFPEPFQPSSMSTDENRQCQESLPNRTSTSTPLSQCFYFPFC